MNNHTFPIWDPATGILDLEDDPEELSASEIPGIKAIWTDQRNRLKDSEQLSDFTEKLSREWAIETGIIENLYEIERGVTRTLIEQGFQAELLGHGSTNRPRDYVIQLLQDQKYALEGVFAFVKEQRTLSVSYIKELHAILLRSQDTTEGLDSLGQAVQLPLIKGNWKQQENYPVKNGVTYTYCPPEQVQSEMDRLIDMHSKQVGSGMPSEVRAAWFHHRFSQIHPFQDGNGRVARALASLILVQDGLFPLVVKRDDKAQYLKALEAADDGKLGPLVDFIAKLQRDQFRKATAIPDAVLVEEDVQAALDGLLKAADKAAADQLATLKKVFDLAKMIEDDLEGRLNSITGSIQTALRRVKHDSKVFVQRSDSSTDHYFRAQISENAKHHIGYFADPI